MNQSYKTQLETNGFFVLERAIPRSLCSTLLQLILNSVQETSTDYILQSNFRLHSPLPINSLTRRSISVVVEPVYDVLNDFLLGNDQGPTDLVELSSITVFPYAAAQDIHPDEQNPGARLLSCFVNLAPTRAELGALQIIPGTHKDLETRYTVDQAVPVELTEGSAVIMNSKTWHGGGANRTLECIRPVFYFSLGQSDLPGPTYSIRDDVSEMGLTLKDFAPASDCRFTGWNADSRPKPNPQGQIVRDVADPERLMLLTEGQLLGDFRPANVAPWVPDVVNQVAMNPEAASLGELHATRNIDPLELVRFFDAYGKAGWFCWSS